MVKRVATGSILNSAYEFLSLLEQVVDSSSLAAVGVSIALFVKPWHVYLAGALAARLSSYTGTALPGID